MHIVVGLVLLCVLAWLAFRAFDNSGREPAAPERPPSREAADAAAQLDIAFVSDGKLFHRSPGGPIREHQSPHAQEVRDRTERSRQRNAWKENTSFGVAANGGRRSFDAPDEQFAVTSAVFDEKAGSLIYFLRDATVGGLFACRPGSAAEQRILLKQNLRLEDLRLSPEGDMLAAAAPKADGTCSIVQMKRDGSELRDITAGDTRDTAPAWIPGAARRLLFQSIGIARHESGYIAAYGNASIQMLDLDSGTVSPVLEDARYDFIQPRVCPAGNLHFIRRPFDEPKYSANNAFADTLLFPFRLLRALFHYLNFFSLMYSRKPLTSASGPEVQADIRDIILQGKRIDAKKLMQERGLHGVPPLVPKSWELVCRKPDGSEQVLATNVASYDIDARGRVVYSNGRGVFVIGADGRSALALKGDLVAQVLAARLPAQAAATEAAENVSWAG